MTKNTTLSENTQTVDQQCAELALSAQLSAQYFSHLDNSVGRIARAQIVHFANRIIAEREREASALRTAEAAQSAGGAP